MQRSLAFSRGLVAIFALHPLTTRSISAESVLPSATSLPPRRLLVKTENGILSGAFENGMTVFRGIPFAAPPVGSLRWREPQPVQGWEGVRQATTYGNACLQPKGMAVGEALGDPGSMSEDCLYLNVWTPDLDALARRPVIVWIHGGALVIGAGSLDGYNGSTLAKKGAVVVTFNYRLGPLVFFAHPALERESPGGPVNFGLFDQVAALKWVQRNIARFGGDPDGVTIAGESAGGQSVLALVASPVARGLFSRAIAESPYGIASHTHLQALRTGIRIATAVGLNAAKATAVELRSVPAKNLIGLRGKGLSLAPGLVVGDKVMPQPFLDAFEKAEEAPVPLVIGNNSDEASVATAFKLDPTRLIRSLGLGDLFLRDLYPGVKDDGELGRYVIRDLIFTSLSRRIADLHSQRAPTWRYYFSYLPVKLRATESGVPHGGEIVFTLGTGAFATVYKPIFTGADRGMSRQVNDYWYEFARTGKPASSGNPVWQNHTLVNDRTMEFGEPIVLRTNFMRHRLNKFIEFLHLMQQMFDR